MKAGKEYRKLRTLKHLSWQERRRAANQSTRGTAANPADWTHDWIEQRTGVSRVLISIYENKDDITQANYRKLWELIDPENSAGWRERTLFESIEMSHPEAIDFRTLGNPYRDDPSKLETSCVGITVAPLCVTLLPRPGRVEMISATLIIDKLFPYVYEWLYLVDLHPNGTGWLGINNADYQNWLGTDATISRILLEESKPFSREVMFLCKRPGAPIWRDFLNACQRINGDPIEIKITCSFRCIATQTNIEKTLTAMTTVAQFDHAIRYCRERKNRDPYRMHVNTMYKGKPDV